MPLSYRKRILLTGLDRRAIADRLRLSYSSLNNRLAGFTRWGDEERELRQILDEAEQRVGEEGCDR